MSQITTYGRSRMISTSQGWKHGGYSERQRQLPPYTNTRNLLHERTWNDNKYALVHSDKGVIICYIRLVFFVLIQKPLSDPRMVKCHGFGKLILELGAPSYEKSWIASSTGKKLKFLRKKLGWFFFQISKIKLLCTNSLVSSTQLA